VLSDSAKTYSDAPESTCSYEDALRILQYLTYMMVNFWSSRDLCAGLRETSRAAEMAAQFCRRL